VVQEDEQIVGVHQTVLGRAVEEVLRVRGKELVDRRRRADERREARPGAAAGAAHLLPRRRDGSGVADADRGVEAADVDPELERVRRDDAADPSVAQARLDRVTLVREVAAAVPADRVRMARRGSERLAQVAREDLDGRPRSREGDRLHATADQLLGEPLAGQQRRAADAELLVGDGRVDDDHVLPPR
jgi:hypothetical protein